MRSCTGKTICKWSNWGSWGKCENGWQRREKSHRGDHCKGAKEEMRSCTGKTKCKWSNWGSWGKCENGWQRREKSYEGNHCQESKEEKRGCTEITRKPILGSTSGSGHSWAAGESAWSSERSVGKGHNWT